jgi:hypothetical protein
MLNERKPKIEEYLMGVPLYYINNRSLPIGWDLLWKQTMKERAKMCLFKLLCAHVNVWCRIMDMNQGRY